MESTTINEATSQVTVIRPKKGLFDIEIANLWQHRELLYFLVWREIKVRYKQAFIGFGWAIIRPVFTMVIFTAIFGRFAKIPSDGMPYPLFAFSALLPWTFFSEALNRGGNSLVGDMQLIQKIYFPRLIIPAAITMAPLVDFALSLMVLFVMMIWYGVAPGWSTLLLPVFIIYAWVQSLALVLWLAPLNVRFRDIRHVLPFLIQIWMYATPIIYPISMIPERWRQLYSLNPMVGVIQGFRWAILGKGAPDIYMLGVSGALVFMLLFSGIIYFNQMERDFADVI